MTKLETPYHFSGGYVSKSFGSRSFLLKLASFPHVKLLISMASMINMALVLKTE